MKVLLPLTWWKLGFIWLSGIESRRPPGRGRALFQNSMRVALIGLTISVAALSFTLAIVSGFQKHLANSVSNIGGHVIHLSTWRSLDEVKSMLKLAPKGVQKIESFWTSQGLVVGPKGGRGILIEGRRELSTTRIQVKSNWIGGTEGVDPVGVRVGKPLAEYLGVEKGSKIKILLPGIVQGAVEASVLSLLDHGTYELDSRLVWVDDSSLRAYLEGKQPEALGKRPGDAHGIRFYLDSKYSLSSNREKLSSWINEYSQAISREKKFKELEPQVLSWEDQKRNLFGSIALDKAMLSVVLSLLVLVAVLNVAATLVVLFLERDKDMAVVLALGMSRLQLVQWISVQGLSLGFVGAFCGILISYLAGQWVLNLPFLKIPAEIYNMSSLPFSFEWAEQGKVLLFGLLTSFVASLLVAIRLSSVNLVQLMGYNRR